ncbi:hypothetical protein AB8Z38_35695 [Bradyrhizobium sp. LLZ17]|uniref:3-isopropylmalate dehydrogenase n=1 Tax=Bradyrhizobium sp. LLZ17 TaxID=3239388 RepID=A0AB39XIQ3_9BRAD
MKSYGIALIPGAGIGREVTATARALLGAAGTEAITTAVHSRFS